MTTPNYRSLWPVLEFFVNRLTRVSYEHQHINPLWPDRCVRLLSESGFGVHRLESSFIISPFLAPLSRALAERCCQLEARLLPRWGCILYRVCGQA